MSSSKPPPDVQEIFGKPGREWTPEEKARVYKWLCEDYQLRYLLLIALRNLGSGATLQDAEDAWQSFLLNQLPKDQSGVIWNYNPERGGFWNYLLTSFTRYCQDQRKTPPTVISLDELREGEEGELPQLELVDPGPGPEDRAIRTIFLEHLNDCLSSLRHPLHRQVFILRDIEGLSEEETAEVLGVPRGSVKGWLRRARLQLRQCLQAKGWKMP